MNPLERLKIFSGSSNPPLAGEICNYLGISLGKAELKEFSDGEIFIDLEESVRGTNVYMIQSTCMPGNKNLMELLVALDALKRASAHEIVAVIPYYGYARQDRKVSPRAPITAKLVANLITIAGADRVVCLDLHAGQIQGFFDIPVDNLFATPLILDYIRHNFTNNLVAVAPDAGGVERARAFAKRLQAGLAIIDKRRSAPNKSEAMHIIGEVEGKIAIILDDMIDTAGTITQAAEALRKEGAEKVYACCTHPVLSGPAVERLNSSCIEEVVVTDTIPLRDNALNSPKIKVLSTASLLGEAIKRIQTGDSVSSLFV
ncbi:MAG: ribose-phosphate diphosphokinase [Thermodesulfobacteriota bacterium]